jgi:hypothetical protein
MTDLCAFRHHEGFRLPLMRVRKQGFQQVTDIKTKKWCATQSATLRNKNCGPTPPSGTKSTTFPKKHTRAWPNWVRTAFACPKSRAVPGWTT